MSPCPRRLLLIVYSELLQSGGGKETWLDALLRHPRVLTYYDEIHVIFAWFSSHEPQALIPARISARHVFFHPIDLKGMQSSLEKQLRFAWGCRKVFAAHAAGEFSQGCTDAIAVGTFHEVVGLLAARTQETSAQIRWYSWIRSTWVKEIAHRHSRAGVWLLGAVERLMLHGVDRCIANGYDTQSAYPHAHVIPNGIACAEFIPSERPLSEARLRVGFVARLSPEKGILPFLRTVAMIAKDPRAQALDVLILGDGKCRAEVEALAHHTPFVRVKPSVPHVEMPRVLGELDVSVHLSLSGVVGGSGVSHGLLESMAAGHVVVCWDTPTFRQVVSEDCAYLVPENDVRRLAEVLLKIVEERELALQKRTKAIERARDFSFDAHVDRFLSFVSAGRSSADEGPCVRAAGPRPPDKHSAA